MPDQSTGEPVQTQFESTEPPSLRISRRELRSSPPKVVFIPSRARVLTYRRDGGSN